MPYLKRELIPPPNRNEYYVHIQTRCPHCAHINFHRVNSFYRIFKCVDARCEGCQNHYYITPPKDEYPEVKCTDCEERLECLLNGVVPSLAWEQGYEEGPWREHQFPFNEEWSAHKRRY